MILSSKTVSNGQTEVGPFVLISVSLICVVKSIFVVLRIPEGCEYAPQPLSVSFRVHTPICVVLVSLVVELKPGTSLDGTSCSGYIGLEYDPDRDLPVK